MKINKVKKIKDVFLYVILTSLISSTILFTTIVEAGANSANEVIIDFTKINDNNSTIKVDTDNMKLEAWKLKDQNLKKYTKEELLDKYANIKKGELISTAEKVNIGAVDLEKKLSMTGVGPGVYIIRDVGNAAVKVSPIIFKYPEDVVKNGDVLRIIPKKIYTPNTPPNTPEVPGPPSNTTSQPTPSNNEGDKDKTSLITSDSGEKRKNDAKESREISVPKTGDSIFFIMIGLGLIIFTIGRKLIQNDNSKVAKDYGDS